MADEPSPPPSLPDLDGLLGMAMDLQQQVAAAQQAAAEQVVTGQAGGGAVRIEVSGGFEFLSVTIAPEALDPNDVDMLQDLVLAALRDAVEQVEQLQSAADPLAGMRTADAGGLDLGGLMGALGVGDAPGADERDGDATD